MGVVVTMIEENLDVITGVWSVNYGETYAHFQLCFVSILMLDKEFKYEGFILIYFYRIYVLL
jgi:hypothetical protein